MRNLHKTCFTGAAKRHEQYYTPEEASHHVHPSTRDGTYRITAHQQPGRDRVHQTNLSNATQTTHLATINAQLSHTRACRQRIRPAPPPQDCGANRQLSVAPTASKQRLNPPRPAPFVAQPTADCVFLYWQVCPPAQPPISILPPGSIRLVPPAPAAFIAKAFAHLHQLHPDNSLSPQPHNRVQRALLDR